jgi:DNA polymerase
MLAALNLQRAQGVYIANAVKCRPPENRTPETGEIDACNGFLNRQIAMIQPQVIVVLGRPAAYAVLGQEASIQSLRGSVHYREQGGRRIPVIVTYHPAYLLRQPAEKWKAWQDLLLADSALKALPA